MTRLEKVPTRKLMSMLAAARKTSDYTDCGDPYCSCRPYNPAEQAHDIEEIKRALSTREHVLNKPEAKALRRQRAMEARRGNLRGNKR